MEIDLANSSYLFALGYATSLDKPYIITDSFNLVVEKIDSCTSGTKLQLYGPKGVGKSFMLVALWYHYYKRSPNEFLPILLSHTKLRSAYLNGHISGKYMIYMYIIYYILSTLYVGMAWKQNGYPCDNAM